MKKVTFDNLVTIYYFKDDHEYKKRYWENFYIDRLRFRDRIKKIETILSPVFQKR